MLWANKLFATWDLPPMLCFNSGTLGFCIDYDTSMIENMIGKLVSGDMNLIPIYGLRVTGQLTDDKGHKININNRVINEVTISRSGGSVVVLNFDVDNKNLCTMSADGVILASSNGSTA